MEKPSKVEKLKLRPLITLILVLIVLISVSTYIVYIYHNTFKENQINKWEQQLLSTIEISSLNLETYVDKFSDNLLNISFNPTLKNWDFYSEKTDFDSLYCPIKTLYEISKKEIDAILLLDTLGVIIKRFSYFGNQFYKIGNKCCNSIENELRLDEGQVYVSDVFTNWNDAKAINISCPVYKDKTRIALLRWMIRMDTLSSRFINPVKIGSKGYMWFLDNYNNILSHPDNKLLNQKIYVKDISESKIFESFPKDNKEFIESKEFYNNIIEKDKFVGKSIDPSTGEYNLSAFRKVSMGNKTWTLLINLPYSEINDPIKADARRKIVFLIVISIAIFIVSFMFYTTQKKKIQLEIEKKYLTKIASTAEELKEERSKRVHAVIAGQEGERKRISRELHDGIGQMLLAIKVKLEGLTNSSGEIENNKIKDIKDISVKTIEEIKRISDDLMPVILDELDIVTSLKNLCDEFQSTYKIEIDFVSFGVSEKLNGEIKTNIFRIAQEALNNLSKYSKATEANVQLLGNEDQLTLIISDNGIGFSVDNIDSFKGNGLHNMKDRTSILKGVITIDSEIDNGTEINVKIPLIGD
ncbi:MAG: hypothetical protein K9J13_07015 [Saprospiraceae bacterium]|nr:hypothetical protein [Saprospiraceae bacterium]